MITILTIYIIGFLLTLTFFKYFGLKIGFDYDSERDEDDWRSNTQAFTAFSLSWVIIIPMLLILGSFKMIFKFGKWYLKN